MFTLCRTGFEKQIRASTSSFIYVYAINNAHYSDLRIKMLLNDQLKLLFSSTRYEE